IAAFRKLHIVLEQMSALAGEFEKGSSGEAAWLSASREVLEEFSRRVPEMTVVVKAYNDSAPKGRQLGLLRATMTRLLMYYYKLLPEFALGTKFDVNVMLGNFLQAGEEPKGARLLEFEDLLAIAEQAQDVRWW